LFSEHRTLSSIEEVRLAWETWPPHGVESVPAWQLPLLNTLTLLLSGTPVRSEERRVGKQGSAQWAPYPERNKRK